MLRGGVRYDLGEIWYVSWAFAGSDHYYLCMAVDHCVHAEADLVHFVPDLAVR